MSDSSYSDEPVIVRAGSASPKRRILLAAAILLVLILLSLAIHPLWLYWQKQSHERGERGGVVSSLRVEGVRVAMELFREEDRLFLSFSPSPVDNGGGRLIQSAEVAIVGQEETFHSVLDWNGEREVFGPSVFRIAPVHDANLLITLHGVDGVLWQGTRWTFGFPVRGNTR